MRPFEYYSNLISNIIIVLFISFGVAVTYIGLSHFNSQLYWSYFVVAVPVALVLACYSLFYINPEMKIKISIALFSTYGTLFVLNTALNYYDEKFIFSLKSTKIIDVLFLHEKKGIGWDHRNMHDVVLELRKTKERVFPITLPVYLQKHRIQRRNFLFDSERTISPLNGISKATTVMCNETGEWVNYKSDRLGFNNDDSVYDNISSERIVLLGDSFSHGYCLDPEKNLAGQLKSRGRNVINLGSAGSGHLTQLAIMKEFVPSLKPKYIFWIINHYDTLDLKHEYEDEFLPRYLEKDFSQNLVSKQQEVDLFWENLLGQSEEVRLGQSEEVRLGQSEEVRLGQSEEVRLGQSEEVRLGQSEEVRLGQSEEVRLGQSEEVRLGQSERMDDALRGKRYLFKMAITLGYIRQALGLTRTNNIDIEPVLKQAKIFTDMHGIKLFLVYIPMKNVNSILGATREKTSINSIAQKLSISMIDLEEYIEKKKAPRSKVGRHYTMGKHYGENGYSLLADVIEKEGLS